MEIANIRDLLADSLAESKSKEESLKDALALQVSQNSILEFLLKVIKYKDNDEEAWNERDEMSEEAFDEFISVLVPNEYIQFVDAFTDKQHSYFILLDNNTLLLLDKRYYFHPSMMQGLVNDKRIKINYRIIKLDRPLIVYPTNLYGERTVNVIGTNYPLHYQVLEEDDKILGQDVRCIISPISIIELASRYKSKLDDKKKERVMELK